MTPMKEATIYSDGSCEGNPGPGGWAAIVDVSGKRVELTGSTAQTTNNRMELLAVIEGLRSLEEPSRVNVITDSQYVVNGMKTWIHNWRRKNWRTASGDPVKNRDLWEELDEKARRHRVTWTWIRGHAGHPENERADFLAREATQANREQV
jgi:ribonuclease HI